MMPRSSAVSLPRMNHGVSSTTLRPRGKALNGSQRVLHRQRKWAINNKDDDNGFFFPPTPGVSSRICPARANGQPRSLYLRTQAHARGTLMSSSWPVGIWTVDSVARQCETTHSSKCQDFSLNTMLLCLHILCTPLISLSVRFFSVSTTEKRAKRMATWEYRGYSSGCDNGARRHSERDIHQLLSGLAETLATMYWLQRELLRRRQEALVVRLNFVFFRLGLRKDVHIRQWCACGCGTLLKGSAKGIVCRWDMPT